MELPELLVVMIKDIDDELTMILLVPNRMVLSIITYQQISCEFLQHPAACAITMQSHVSLVRR